MTNEPSIFLQLRRFRRRLKEKEKRKHRRIVLQNQFTMDVGYRSLGKKIKNYSEAIKEFLPTTLSYLSVCEESPLYIRNLSQPQYTEDANLTVPKNFSLIDNEIETSSFLQSVAATLFWQACRTLRLDYVNCTYCDLATQIILDSILKDYDKFIHRCQRARLNPNRIGIKISSIGGNHIYDESIQKLIHSVGSPVVLKNKSNLHRSVEPYKLRYYEAREASKLAKSGQKEIDSTTLIEYLDRCLARLNKQLSTDARQDLGYILGETLANAEEHSSLHSRYLIGYFEESKDTTRHYGLLNLVIMNYGKTIYEKFKYPEEDVPFNTRCQERMKELSDSFHSRHIFTKDEFTEETLWTLYSLQGGVSCIPPEVKKRGNGTIQFIESFFKIKGDSDVDNVSRMTIWSGKARIDFDGLYHPGETLDENGKKIGVMTFNKSGTINEKPDPKYVYSTKSYFPGTLIFAKILINEDDILYEQ